MTSMRTDRVRKWMTLGLLALAPLAHAKNDGPVDEGQRASVQAGLAAPPVKSPEDMQLEALKKELDAIRTEVEALRARDDRRQRALSDPDALELWP